MRKMHVNVIRYEAASVESKNEMHAEVNVNVNVDHLEHPGNVMTLRTIGIIGKKANRRCSSLVCLLHYSLMCGSYACKY